MRRDSASSSSSELTRAALARDGESCKARKWRQAALTRTLGLSEVLASCDVALMACRGAKSTMTAHAMAVQPSAISSSARTGVWTCIFPLRVIESPLRGGRL